MIKKAVIIGYSGHAFVVLDVLLSENYQITGYCEQKLKSHNPFNLTYLGSEDDGVVLEEIRDHHIFIGIGNNLIRESVLSKLISLKFSLPEVIHNRAYVSGFSSVGSGTIVMPGAVINANAKVGIGVICNTSSVIEHECTIEDFSHIAPGAVLAGNVSVGKGSFIGANAVIRQGVRIGSNVIIGAGSVVIKDVPDGLTLYGNPVK